MSIHMATDGAPFPGVEDDLRRQIMGLRASLASAEAECCAREEVQARLIRERNAAEAEVARLKALLEAKQPYTPRVGDVVLFDVESAESAEATPRVVTSVEPDGWWSCVHLNRRRDAVACGPFRISGRIGGVRLHRPATPAERAAAGLPAEAPAKPEVLPEHLAFLDAMAAERTEESHIERPYAVYRTTTAARALLAAVARRDGGAK